MWTEGDTIDQPQHLSEPAVRVWRPPDLAGVVLMSGVTSSYEVSSYAEYVFGIVEHSTMTVRRGRSRYDVGPGELVAWDPSAAHGATTSDDRPWSAHIAVVELAALRDLLEDPDESWSGPVAFPEPVVADRLVVEQFRRCRAVLVGAAPALEQETALALWLRLLVQRGRGRPRSRSPRPGRDPRAVRVARDVLESAPQDNVSLDELAAAAGIGKFRLVRSFAAEFGVPPHRYHLGVRLARVRRALEAGRTPADAAASAGFADQSHLHRHFRRSTGMTPAAYARAVVPSLRASARSYKN